MTELEKAFNTKLTENSDKSFVSTGDKILDYFFMIEYYREHLNEIEIGNSPFEKLFAMFMRDPRKGMGQKDIGRVLMHKSEVPGEMIAFAGRFDDLYLNPLKTGVSSKCLDYLYEQICNNNELAKKWAPRFSSSKKDYARVLARRWGMNKQTYGKIVKANTIERALSEKNTKRINFEHVPSLALLKYWKRFLTGIDTKDRFNKYLVDVKNGNFKINTSITNPYDLYKNRQNVDTDLIFEKLNKVSGSWLPIIDTSGSMWDNNDSIGKALSIGHYLAKTSSYCPDTMITFASNPKLINISNLKYNDAINKMNYNSDCSNTDLGKVMKLLKDNLHEQIPEYLVVLSDMEFDYGSSNNKDELMKEWKERGINTKIIWWNFNSRNKTAPETDEYGNILISGYNTNLLRFLEEGFDGKKFLMKLLFEYSKYILSDFKE